jgi:hypothetical protein
MRSTKGALELVVAATSLIMAIIEPLPGRSVFVFLSIVLAGAGLKNLGLRRQRTVGALYMVAAVMILPFGILEPIGVSKNILLSVTIMLTAAGLTELALVPGAKTYIRRRNIGVIYLVASAICLAMGIVKPMNGRLVFASLFILLMSWGLEEVGVTHWSSRT